MIKAHPQFEFYFQVLTRPTCYQPWQGNVIRQAAPRWLATAYRLTGLGSALAGGRWSVKGLMPSVYAATNPDTLNAEAHHWGRKYGWTEKDFHPQLRVGMHWQLHRVLNLTAPANLEALATSSEALSTCDWQAEQLAGQEAQTQAIARAAFENLAEALLVPSARQPGGMNVVLFPSHRRPESVLTVLNQQDLPPDRHGLDP